MYSFEGMIKEYETITGVGGACGEEPELAELNEIYYLECLKAKQELVLLKEDEPIVVIGQEE